MTDVEFESRVAELIASGRMAFDARLEVGVNAGRGGDVDGGMADEDPAELLERLGDDWRPLPPRQDVKGNDDHDQSSD